MLGDQSQELVRFEARHEHQMVALQQPDGERGEPGVVLQRHRHQVDVTLLRAQRIAGVGGNRLSPPDSISLGRPVLPPDAIDFHTGETASGNAAVG